MATTALSFGLAVSPLSIPRAKAADFNWKQEQGKTISVSFNQHPYADAIIQQLPKFKELTGIDVKYELTPEENYFDKVTTQLSAGTGVPDVFMTGVYQMWDYASAKRIEPLDEMLGDAAATSPDYNPKDIFEGVFNAGKWDLKPGSPPGSGKLWCVPLGFELYCLAYNKKYFDEKGSEGPDDFGGAFRAGGKAEGLERPRIIRGSRQRHPKLGDDPPWLHEQFRQRGRQGLRHRGRKAHVRVGSARIR